MGCLYAVHAFVLARVLRSIKHDWDKMHRLSPAEVSEYTQMVRENANRKRRGCGRCCPLWLCAPADHLKLRRLVEYVEETTYEHLLLL